MALIFRHIPRKGFLADPEQDFGILKNTDFSEQHLLELPDGKRAIVHFFTGNPDPKWPIQVMLKSEKFVRNATKHIILEKPQYYVPTINFFFRIEFSLQLNARCIVQLLSGSDDARHIEYIIKMNPSIFKKLEILREIAMYVYRAEFVVQKDNNPALINRLIGALVELLAARYREDSDPVTLYIGTQYISRYLSYNSFYGAATMERSEITSRHSNKHEIEAYTSNFDCVICRQQCLSTTELLNHVRISHSEMTCVTCNVKYDSYRELVHHSLTFCRRPILIEKCGICKMSKHCACAKRLDLLVEMIQKYIDDNNDNPTFTDINYSLIYEAFCKLQEEEDVIKVIDEPPSTANINIEPKLGKLIPELRIEDEVVRMPYADGTTKDLNFADCFKAISETGISYSDYKNLILKYMKRHNDKCPICHDQWTSKHLDLHLQCPLMSHLSEEFPSFFECKFESWMQHLEKHRVLVPRDIKCGNCDEKIVMGSPVKWLKMYKHIKEHDAKLQTCMVHTCDKLNSEMSGSEQLIHLLVDHCVTADDLLQIATVWYEQTVVNKTQNRGHKGQNTKNESQAASGSDRPSLTIKIRDNIEKDLERDSGSEEEDDKDKKNKKSEGSKTPDKDNKNTIKCNNERHKIKPRFDTELEKTRHLIEEHSCFVKNCHRYFEMEEDLLAHYKATHDRTEKICPVCKGAVPKLSEHIKMHPRCTICLVYCKDNVELKHHQVTCQVMNSKNSVESKPSNYVPGLMKTDKVSVLTDNFDRNLQFNETLLKLVNSTDFSEPEKDACRSSIQAYCADMLKSKKQERSELISNRISAELMLDIPTFCKTGNTNSFQKVLQSIGKIPENDRFNAVSTEANTQAICNYEKLDQIVKQIDEHTLIGQLTESQGVYILGMYLSQSVIDEVAAYNLVTELKYLSFHKCISSLQYIFVPLQLEQFLAIVQNYRINQQVETFLSFASRVTRHLSLCARLESAENREQFIESFRIRILKANLPYDLQKKIDAKERLYTAYNSNELIDIMISHSERTGKSSAENPFRVYSIRRDGENREKPATTLRVKKRPTSKESKDANASRQNKNAANARGNRYVNARGRDSNRFASKTGPRVAALRKGEFDTNKGSAPLRPKTDTKKYKDILQKLKVSYSGAICFLCLGPHLAPVCDIYKTKLNPVTKLCHSITGHTLTIFGWHDAPCKHELQTAARVVDKELFKKYCSIVPTKPDNWKPVNIKS